MSKALFLNEIVFWTFSLYVYFTDKKYASHKIEIGEIKWQKESYPLGFLLEKMTFPS
jgi:hypothetical protein